MKTELRLLCLLTCLCPFNLSATLITPVINSSSISISGNATGEGSSFSYGASQRATLPALFDATLSDSATVKIPGVRFPSEAWSSASQFSSVTSTHIEARADVQSFGFTTRSQSGDRGYGSASAESVFDLIFMLNEPANYVIAGYVAGSGRADLRSFTLSLLGSTEPILDLEYLWDATGVLPAGTYELRALARNSAGDGNRHHYFNFTMDFAPAEVPDTGSTLALLSIAFLACVRFSRRVA